MASLQTYEGRKCHRCDECLLYYKDKEIAEKCEAWCKAHNSCNLEITKQSLQRKQGGKR